MQEMNSENPSRESQRSHRLCWDPPLKVCYSYHYEYEYGALTLFINQAGNHLPHMYHLITAELFSLHCAHCHLRSPLHFRKHSSLEQLTGKSSVNENANDCGL
uniref:Uncharacterized protein n=1 Tax=Cacopsylla melanoneura TaxID=428564 RepID=A0A8D9B5Y8_9HEMI